MQPLHPFLSSPFLRGFCNKIKSLQHSSVVSFFTLPMNSSARAFRVTSAITTPTGILDYRRALYWDISSCTRKTLVAGDAQGFARPFSTTRTVFNKVSSLGKTRMTSQERKSSSNRWEELAIKKANWEEYANSPDHNPCIDRVPGKRWKWAGDKKICDVGDSVLFNALLCYSGDMKARDAVQHSQDARGRWWRSPVHFDARGRPTEHSADPTTFSRDHALGVLLYLVTNPDRETARRQARDWFGYIVKTSGIVNAIIDAADPSLPIKVQEKLLKSLIKCGEGRGITEDGCIVHEVEERIGWVLKKVIQGLECVGSPRNLSRCFKKELGKVKVEVFKQLSLATFRICDEGAPECVVSPPLLYLMLTVLIDLHLDDVSKLKPFLLISNLYPDIEYDAMIAAFVLAEAADVDTDKLHAINALIRAVTGRPARLTMEALIQKRPHHPFYQYLYHRYVDPQKYSLEEIRDRLLNMAPTVRKEGEGETAKFYNIEDNTENTGHQWAWERPDYRKAIWSTMGWDCIFIANLLGNKLEENFLFYKEKILQIQIDEHQKAIENVLDNLKESVAQIDATESEFRDFIEQATIIIEHREASAEELRGIRSLVENKCQAMDKILQQRVTLSLAKKAAGWAFEEFSLLKRESKQRFQDAGKIDQFETFWEGQYDGFVEIEVLLEKARLMLFQKSLAMQLTHLLAAIPLRIEQERIENVGSEIARIEESLIQSIRMIAGNFERSRVNEELTGALLPIAEALAVNQESLHYSEANQQVDELQRILTKEYHRLKGEALAKKLLDEGTLEAIYHSFKKDFVEKRISLWKDLVNRVGAGAIIRERLYEINNRAQMIFEKVQRKPVEEQKVLFANWVKKARKAGYSPPNESKKEGAYQEAIHWRFLPIESSSEQEWVLFDGVLRGLERVCSEFERI